MRAAAVAHCRAMALIALSALVSCAGAPISPPGEPTASTPSVGVHDQLRAAFQIAERPARRDAVLSLLPAFLDDLARRPSDDDAASALLSDIAFASGRMIFTDPAFIRRYQDLAVVGLPDAMGLVSLSRADGLFQPPVEISHWTAGLDSVELTPHNNEAGVVYVTLGVDRSSRVRYALLRRTGSQWETVWLAEEVPEWWFNATNAAIALAPDLGKITLVGDAVGTTSVFLEDSDRPRRRFRLGWERVGDSYTPVPAMGGADNRQNWLWQIAEPSAYATLVEFLERLRVDDGQGAAALVTQPDIVAVAQSFGLSFPDNVYAVTLQNGQRIEFQGRQGAFVATFQPPAPGSPPDARWLIAGIAPLGAAPPTPSP